MTRITFVSYDDDPPQGGQGIMVRGLRGALEARGHTVSTISGRGVHAVPFPRVTGRAPLDLSMHLNRHPELIAERGGEVIHAHGGPGGVLLLRDLGTPLVYSAYHTYRQAHPRRSPRRLLAPLEARAYRRAARVLALSPSTEIALRALRVRRERVQLLPPGVDETVVRALPRDGSRLLFAGRWEHEKGVLDAVTVMRRVIAARPGASGMVVGAGRLDAAVRARAASTPGIAVAGWVDEARLREEYARAAIVLMPSRYEGLGLTALEAQVAGAVVVGFDVEGLRDAVRDGVLVAAGDIAEMVAACVRLLDDGKARARRAAAGQRRVRRENSWTAAADRLEQVYATVLERR